MPVPELPLHGGCRCGATRFEITLAPIMTAACHCRGCQRMSASAYSLTLMIPTGGFAVTHGETVRGGIRGPQLDHRFCPECLTWMFTRIEGVDAFLNVRPTMLDDPAWFRPFIETMTAEKLPWAEVPTPHSYAAFPGEQDYPALMQEFAGWIQAEDSGS